MIICMYVGRLTSRQISRAHSHAPNYPFCIKSMEASLDLRAPRKKFFQINAPPGVSHTPG